MKTASVNLLSFIDIAQKQSSTEMSDSARDKNAVCRAALEAFSENHPCLLEDAVLSRFVYDFGIFLANDYPKRYSPATNREILRTLRKYIRIAIVDGLVPNIDVVPDVIRRLDDDVWSDSPERRKSPSSSRLDLRLSSAVAALSRFLDTWSTRSKMGNAQPADRRQRTVALENRCAAVYLFCLSTCGLEIEDALAIPRDWEGREIPDSVYVPKFGIRIPLSPAAKKLVAIYNQGALCSRHLFFTLDNGKYGDNLENAAKLIADHICGALSRLRLPLFRRRSCFVDWLNYLVENGLPSNEAENLWLGYIGQTLLSAETDRLTAAQYIVNSSRGDLDETWYLLSLIPLSIKRDRLLRLFIASGILGDEREARRRIYAPEEKNRDKLRGEFPVFSRYIFFRATPVQALFANTFTPYAYVLKDRASNCFAQIRRSEIESLQVMLRDFPDAVEIIDGNKWLQQHNAQIVEGSKAIIRSGSLAGKEATVIKIKGKDTQSPTYFIEYVQGALKFQTDLPGILLDLPSQ